MLISKYLNFFKQLMFASISGGGGGGGGGKTQTNDPWKGAQSYMTGREASTKTNWLGNTTYTPAVTGVLPEAQNIYNRSQSPNADTQNSWDLARQLAGQIPGQADAMSQFGFDLMNGKYLDPNSNPELANYVTAATRPLQTQLLENILPSVRGGAIQAGGYGGARQGITEGRAIGDYLTKAGDISSSIYANAYESERARQMQAPAIIQQALQTGLIAPQVLSSIGTQQQQLPWDMLNNYANIIYGAAGQGGSVTTNPGSNPLGGALGGAAVGSTFGPWGAVIGGGLGLLLG